LSDSPIIHFGTVIFGDAGYARAGGSADWTVQPIAGFGLQIGPPLGQVRISFREAISQPYTALATALRLPTTPTLVVNIGNVEANGFIVHLFDPIGSRTLQNGGFSFLVLCVV
jgi:hypothetical protein